MINGYSSNFRKLVYAGMALVVLIALSLFYYSQHNLSFYQSEQKKLSNYSLDAMQTFLLKHVDDLRHSVEFFVHENQKEIQDLAHNPLDNERYNHLKASVNQFFPQAATFTIADAEGRVMMEDRENLVGNGCRKNLRLFAISNQQSNDQLRIHSDHESYHFDVMHEMHLNDGKIFIFYISFKPTIIASLIKQLQLSGHQLMLVRDGKDNLIDVDHVGANVGARRDSHLTVDEVARIVSSKSVPKTQWLLVDILDQDMIDSEFENIMIESLILFLFCLCLIVGALIMFKRYEED